MEQQLENYIKSPNFMRIGQAINKGQWQSAAMISGRLSRQAKELGLDNFERNFTGLRQSINRKNTPDAKQNLAIIINKRVQLLNQLNSNHNVITDTASEIEKEDL